MLMIGPIIATIVSLGLLSVFIPPSMPLYSVRGIKLVNFYFTSWTLDLSAKLYTGIQVQNDNVVGADLYSAHVHIYYPDWNGELQNVGYLEETKTDKNSCALLKSNPSNKLSTDGIERHDESNPCVFFSDPLPFFAVQARGFSTSDSNAFTVYLENVSFKTYMNMLKNLIIYFGSIEVIISGAANVKLPLGIPVTSGIICDNDLELTLTSIQVLGRSCLLEGVSAGWAGLNQYSDGVKDQVMKYYIDLDGDIFHKHEKNI